MKSSDPANIKISFFFMELSSFLWGFSFAWCPKGMRLLLLPPFAFVCVCQDPLIALDSLSLKQFGEKDGGHRDPELREGVRDEGQARSIQLPLLLLSLCCTSSWQQLGLAHPEHSASWSYFPSLTHLRQVGQAQRWGTAGRRATIAWGHWNWRGEEVQIPSGWGCREERCVGMWVHSRRSDSINFALQETTCNSLDLSGIHKWRKKEGICGLLYLLNFYSFSGANVLLMPHLKKPHYMVGL